MNTSEIYKQITEKIISNLETAGGWKKMWSMPSCVSLNGHFYTGVNKLILGTDKYETPVYGTFEQIRHHGGMVRKGEKASMVVFVKRTKAEDKETKEEKTLFLLRYYFVFNVAQADFDDIGKEYIQKLVGKIGERKDNVFNRDAEQVIADWHQKPKMIFSHKEDRAYYSPSSDLISVPAIEYFKDSASYYETLFHEIIHSTGHSSRLNRFENGSGKFGSVEYSKEELVAEMGAAYMCAVCNIDNDIKNTAAYIKSWAQVLRDNYQWVFHAAGKAEMAANFVLNVQADSIAA